VTEEKSIVEVHSRLDRLEVTLTHTVETIEKLAEVVNRPQDTKWGPILTALSLLFVAASGYTTLTIMPIKDRAVQHEVQIYQLREEAFALQRDIGRLEGRLGISINE